MSESMAKLMLGGKMSEVMDTIKIKSNYKHLGEVCSLEKFRHSQLDWES